MIDLIPKIKARVTAKTMFQRFWPAHYRERGNCRCPWHEDATESLQLSDEFVYCHACGFSLDCIDLYQRGAGVDSKEALQHMASELGLNGNPSKHTRQTKHTSSTDFLKRWKKIAKNTIPDEARSYLEETRALAGIFSGLVEGQYIAFDPKYRAWNHDLDQQETWQALAFPLTDAGSKEMLGIQYISIDGSGKKFAKGTNGKEGFFFYGDGKEYFVVTGAVIDALSVHVACRSKMDIGVCSILSEGKGYAAKLGKLSRPQPVLFFDNDSAGEQITVLAAEVLDYNCRIIDWSLAPSGINDANDLLKAGHADIIERMVRTSRVPTKEELSGTINTDRDEMQRRLAELNREYSVVMLGGKCLVMRQVKDPIFGRQDVVFSSFNDFRNFHGNEKYWFADGNGKAKKKTISEIWLERTDRTQFDGIVFTPDTASQNGYYNLWRGFDVESKKGQCDRLLDHIHQNIAGRDSKIYQYVMAWMAEIVQNPGGKRPGVSLVLRGKQGVGKGCLADYFGKILGNHFLHVTQASQLTGKFNNHLKDALLVFADEAFWAGDKGAEGVLKGMITEDIIMIEPKGRDPFAVKNHVRLLIASNNDWLVPAGPQERRFCVLQVSDKHQQDHKYFNKIYKEMASGGRGALLHMLLEADISGFDFYDFPKTEALLDQKLSSMSSVGKFWYECLRRGSIKHSSPDYPGLDWSSTIPTEDLYRLYLNECKDRNDRHPFVDAEFGKKLKDLCPTMRRKRPYGTGGSRYWQYHFGTLEQCRQDFNTITMSNTQWDEDID
jgi:hypothetical protein